MNSAEQAFSGLVWDRSGAMGRIQDESLLRLVALTFHRDAPMLLARIQRDLQEASCKEAVVAAHALKAAAANVGAEQCRALAAAMELRARSGEKEEVQRLMLRFEDEFRRFQAALAESGWLSD